MNEPKDSTGTSIRARNSLTNDALRTSYDAVFESYNSKNGYPARGLIDGSMYIDTKGIVWASAEDKLVRFHYNAIHKNSNPPNVFIQSVKLNNENICWYDLIQAEPKTDSNTIPPNIIEEASLFSKALTETQRDTMREKFSGVTFDSITRFYPVPVGLVLPYRHNNIIFDFAAIEPARPNVVGYQYMLEGYDYDWGPINDKTTATFGNIREGQYTFKLKARSPDGIWSEPLTYSFKVLPPWHRTWWAYTLYIASLLTAIWVFIRWRVKALRKEKVLLE